MIGMGGYYLGPELERSPIARHFHLVSDALDEACGPWEEGDAPAVIVLFIVPGSLGDVSFSGQRTTLFSRRKKLLQIEAATPRELLSADRVADLNRFAVDAFRRACRTAAEVFTARKVSGFDLTKAEEIVDQLQERLGV